MRLRWRLRTLMVAVAVAGATSGLVVDLLSPTGVIRRAIGTEWFLLVWFVWAYPSVKEPLTWVAIAVACLMVLTPLNLAVAAIGWWRPHSREARARDRAAARPEPPVESGPSTPE